MGKKLLSTSLELRTTLVPMSSSISDRYSIIRTLGSGGFGETFLAEDLHVPSKRRCVIKRLKPVTGNPQVHQIVQERFGREAAILEMLGDRHAQIPRLYAYFESEGEFYLVQEWIEGITLSAWVQREGKLAVETVGQLLADLLPVLSFVHEQRIIHRDIKPENIIVRQSDRLPVLIDFGAVKEAISTQIDSQGGTHSIVIGTPGYMAPEQGVGRPVYASDLYSLGLTAIFLLSGKNPQELASDPATGEIFWYPDALNVPKDLAAVLNRAVQSHPRERFPTAASMLSALGTTPSTTPLSPPQRETPPPEPTPTVAVTPSASTAVNHARPLVMGGAIAGTLVALGIVGGVLLSRPLQIGDRNPSNSTEEQLNEPPRDNLGDRDPSNSTEETSNQSPPETPRESQDSNPLPSEDPESLTLQRLRFAPGSTSAVVDNTAIPNQIQRYRLDARQGQQFNVVLLQGDVEVNILAPDGRFMGAVALDRPTWQTILPRSGDYLVDVKASRTSQYALRLEIAKATKAVQRQRVRFPQGAMGTTLSGSVSSSQNQVYLLGSSQGQQFLVERLQGDVAIAIADPQGRILGTISPNETFWQGQLPLSGDYEVSVTSDSNSAYSIRVEIR